MSNFAIFWPLLTSFQNHLWLKESLTHNLKRKTLLLSSSGKHNEKNTGLFFFFFKKKTQKYFFRDKQKDQSPFFSFRLHILRKCSNFKIYVWIYPKSQLSKVWWQWMVWWYERPVKRHQKHITITTLLTGAR